MRSLVPIPSGSVLSPARTTQGHSVILNFHLLICTGHGVSCPATRRCFHTPLRSRPRTRSFSSSRRMSSQRLLAENDDPVSQSMGASGAEQLTSETDRRHDETLGDNQGVNGYERDVSLPPENESHLAEHLNGLFHPLQFPPELARRILTHASHPAAINGHNAGLSFVGAYRYSCERLISRSLYPIIRSPRSRIVPAPFSQLQPRLATHTRSRADLLTCAKHLCSWRTRRSNMGSRTRAPLDTYGPCPSTQTRPGSEGIIEKCGAV